MNQEAKEPIPQLPDNVGEMTRTFSNPICKETYHSLPKIYGKKQKKNIRLKIHPTQPRSENAANFHNNRHYHSANQQPSISAPKKRANRNHSLKLSEPRDPAHCSRKNCSCKNHSESDLKPRKSVMRRILLPEIKKFELEDLQSYHKVSMSNFRNSRANSSSGLQQIIEEQDKMRSTKGNQFNSTARKGINLGNKNKRMEDESKVVLRRKKIEEISDKKSKHRFKPNFSSKFDIEEESEEEYNTEELRDRNADNPRKDNSVRYKTDANDSESPKSGTSLSLSSFIFRGIRRQNTNFHQLNKTQKSADQKMSRKNSQLSNGLFRIPEEPEYVDYLKSHRPLDPHFTMKKLVKSQNFKIIRGDNEVYFGQVNVEEEKHGLGLNVTQKQIFEGKYENNYKSVGFERNIDGVYEGGFLNGLRSGHGTFKWNNGEIFQGNWEAGMKNGFGVWTSPKGDSYQGEWKNNRQEGQGIFKHRVSTYKGQFKNFLKWGYGEQKFVNGDQYKGQYQNGKPHGKGRYQWQEGGYYDGQFVVGMREGKGKWVDENHTTYQGSFKQDFKHGYGKQTYSSGDRYEGEFMQGNRTKGYLYEKNGNVIEVRGR